MSETFPLENASAPGSRHLVREISGQPVLWQDTYSAIKSVENEIINFLSVPLQIRDIQIILTGAGSSAFIGEILRKSFQNNTHNNTVDIPTTDIVTHPRDFFNKTSPTLLISFARSGDSPESVATFDLAEKMVDQVYHLIITCNAEGNLAKKASNVKNAYVVLLPATSNDQALAMTGSFTSMTLAGLLISDISKLVANGIHTEKLCRYGNLILRNYNKKLKSVSELSFKRVVFLGSGALKGAAKESHLKLLEMTDGQIICQYDSFLGFRHGPRAVVDKSTLLVYLFSGDSYVNRYEIDLVRSIQQKKNHLFSIGIGQCLDALGDPGVDLAIDLCCDDNRIPDDYFSVCSVLPAQILGLYKCIALGLTPDSPSQNGGIHRIVQGVTIYPY